jgi:hypothetical protein
MAMKQRRRGVSRVPAMPRTRFFGQPVASRATPVSVSSRLTTTMRVNSGENSFTFSDTGSTTAMFVRRSSCCETGRGSGGFRASLPCENAKVPQTR